MAKVGIKLADGRFHPILDEYGSVGKRLVLTTVCDGQSSAQIDFYRNIETVAEPMQYIGTLVVDSLPQKYAGETSIELRVRSTGDGRIFAEAYEADGAGGTQKLEIDIAGFSIPEPDTDSLDIGGEQEHEVTVAVKRPFKPLVLVVAVVLALLVAATVFWFQYRDVPSGSNMRTESPAREKAAISPPQVPDETANIPETPPPENSRDSDNSSFSLESAIPDASRKALRTEFDRSL
jgi:hypothetical protein